MPFDRESAFSAASVLLLAASLHSTSFKQYLPQVKTAYRVLEDIESHGGLVATFQKLELQMLEAKLQQLQRPNITSPVAGAGAPPRRPAMEGRTPSHGNNPSIGDARSFHSWDDAYQDAETEGMSEESLNGDQLLAAAEAIDFSQLEWMTRLDFGFGDFTEQFAVPPGDQFRGMDPQ